ncbi:hypothetical protein Tco_1492345 [Tanacetum coccineum]
MWRSIEKGPYVRPMIIDPANTMAQIIEPVSKMTEINKKQYIFYVKVMNYLLQAIPNVSTIQWMRVKLLRKYENELKVEFEPNVQASKAKKAAKNHDPLVLIDNSNASSSQSHASSYYSHSPQAYYVTLPSSVVDYEEDYQGELQGDS